MEIDVVIDVVSSMGDPTDPRTWSGGPYRLLAGLERAGATVRTHDVTWTRGRRHLARVNEVIGLGAYDSERAGPRHTLQQAKAAGTLRRLTAPHVLHFGSDHFPLWRAPLTARDRRHYLFTDYSIHLVMTRHGLAEKVPARFARSVRRTEARMSRQLDRVFTTSWFVRDDWVGTYGMAPDRVVAVGSGVGRVQGLDGFAKDHRTGHLLFVAKQNFDIKGGPLLLDAFDLARATRPDLRLVVIGNSADPESAPYLARMKSHPAIDFREADTPDYLDLIRGAAAYVGPAEIEPWGLIYLEAMLCEAPIIALRRNAMEQFTDRGRLGFLVDQASPAAVAAAILDAMSDPERLARLGRSAHDYVAANFTWDRVAEQMLAHFAEPVRR